MIVQHQWPADWILVCEDDDWADPPKRTFWLVNRAGEKHLLDVSPWRRDVPTIIISMMVDMGIPGRNVFGVIHPLTDEMIVSRWQQQAAVQVAAE